MELIRKKLELNKQNYYITHLSIINCLFPDTKILTINKTGKEEEISQRLTNTEIKVLALFMSLEGDIAEYRFGPTGKKVIMRELDLKPQGLSNHMTSLKLKGFLLEGKDSENKPNGVLKILPILFPEKEFQNYQFRLVNLN